MPLHPSPATLPSGESQKLPLPLNGEMTSSFENPFGGFRKPWGSPFHGPHPFPPLPLDLSHDCKADAPPKVEAEVPEVDGLRSTKGEPAWAIP